MLLIHAFGSDPAVITGALRVARNASHGLPEARIRVVVQDSGSGFAAADLSRVFEKFYRGEQARTRATGGAGLGLALAQAIVEAHGGHMWASNRPAGGAEVGFFLPQNRL